MGSKIVGGTVSIANTHYVRTGRSVESVNFALEVIVIQTSSIFSRASQAGATFQGGALCFSQAGKESGTNEHWLGHGRSEEGRR